MNETKRKAPPNLHILWLSCTFFVSGTVLFLIAMIAAIWLIPGLVLLPTARTPAGWVLAHLFILGWATAVAMGASFQLTQVIMRTSLFSRTMGYVQFAVYMLGLCGLVAGFLEDARLIAFGGIGIALGAVMYVFNLGMTFVRKKEWNLYVFGVSLSLTAFIITIILGIAMGLGAAYGWNVRDYEAVFGSHMWFGLGGWLSGLIIVYSYKLLPMFYVSRKKLTPLSYWTIAAYHLGVWLQSASLWTGSRVMAAAAALLMLAALLSFIIHIAEVRKLSSGKQPIGAVKIALYLIPAISLLFAVWNGLSLFGVHSSRLNEALIISLLLGWFAPTILSYLSKILPFLWWAYRYRSKEAKKSAVLLSEMLPEKRMTWQMYGYLLGTAAVIGGFLAALPVVAVIGQIVAIGFAVIYLLELLRLFRY
jgi:hypothetical protein